MNEKEKAIYNFAKDIIAESIHLATYDQLVQELKRRGSKEITTICKGDMFSIRLLADNGSDRGDFADDIQGTINRTSTLLLIG